MPEKLSSGDNNTTSKSRNNSCGCSSCSSSDSDSMLYNILWNLSHPSAQNPHPLALAQNPWFYTGLSDPVNGGYNALFKDPLDPGMLTPSPRSGRDDVPVIHVLSNGFGRVFFSPEFSKNGKPRVFDIVWAMNDILVFKGRAIMFVLLL